MTLSIDPIPNSNSVQFGFSTADTAIREEFTEWCVDRDVVLSWREMTFDLFQPSMLALAIGEINCPTAMCMRLRWSAAE